MVFFNGMTMASFDLNIVFSPPTFILLAIFLVSCSDIQHLKVGRGKMEDARSLDFKCRIDLNI